MGTSQPRRRQCSRLRLSWRIQMLLGKSSRILWLGLAALAMAADAPPVHAQREGGIFGAGMPTLGSAFVWSDEVWFHDWRIAKHSVIGHYRLLDPQNRRQAFGSFETCLAKLNEVKQ